MATYNGWMGDYNVPNIAPQLSQLVEASDTVRTNMQNRAVGEAAATGKLSDAANVAFKQGNVKTGLALKDINDEQRERVRGILGKAALNVQTPEEWEQVRSVTAKYFPGEEIETWDEIEGLRAGSRDYYKDRELELRKQKMAQDASSDAGGVFGTPIYGEDPETGQTTLGVIGKDGRFRRVDTGSVRVTPGVTFQDLGTSRQGFNTKTGAPVGSAIPIDNTGKAAASAEGKGVGEARTAYTSMNSKMPGLEKVVSDLNVLADKATYTTAGQVLDAGRRQVGMEPREAAIARTKYISMVDNQVLPLLRDTFGAAFTVQEGQSLRATLGDPDKTPAEKKAVLESFIEQKRRDVEALALQSLAPGQQPQNTQGNVNDPLGLR